MRKILHLSSKLALGAAFVLAVGSCTYDPYYTVGGSYSTGYDRGYGSGYGYGGSNFSTSLFVSTGDPRWGYDPSCYSYYDYTRRSYYDPYLYGYYPVGYRPPVIVGVPHPYGYRRTYCPPPSRVTNVTLVNYSNRESAYRNSNHSWARQVRQQPVRQQPMTQPRDNFRGQPQYQQPQQNPGTRSGSSGYWGSREQAPSGGNPRVRGSSSSVQPTSPRTSERQPGLPPSYNVPIRTNPRTDSNPVPQARPSRLERPMPMPQRELSRPQRQVPQPESSRPAPQPRMERPAPSQPPVSVREAPSVQPAPPAAPPAASPAREIRGLGEGGGDSPGPRPGRSR
jgi:hypothetical protein